MWNLTDRTGNEQRATSNLLPRELWASSTTELNPGKVSTLGSLFAPNNWHTFLLNLKQLQLFSFSGNFTQICIIDIFMNIKIMIPNKGRLQNSISIYNSVLKVVKKEFIWCETSLSICLSISMFITFVKNLNF